jgi:hypothetical protein
MSLRFVVFVHEPQARDGWGEVDRNVSPDEAANLARAWGAKGWRVLIVSMECIEEEWDVEFPTHSVPY